LNRRPPTLVLGALLTVAGCTGAGTRPSPTVQPVVTTTTVPATTTTTVETDEAITAYEICLEENGIDIEAIPFDAMGRPRLELVMRQVDFSDSESVEALTECAGHLSTGALDLRDTPVLWEDVGRALTEFSECVRSHGIPDFPDPVEGFAGVGAPYPESDIPFSDPDLDVAVDTCAERLR
jgi:hypothetical protein